MGAISPPLARVVRQRIFADITPLPEAASPDAGLVAGSAPPLRLAVLGDSTAAGVGAPDHEHALAGQLARTLAGLTGRGVSWRVCARSGAPARTITRDLTRSLVLPTEQWVPHVVAVSVGVNDLARLLPMASWRVDVARLFHDIRQRVGSALVVVSGMPPVGEFPAFSPAVRAAAGLRARQMDRELARLAAEAGVTHVPVDRLRGRREFIAPDGYHPSPLGYRSWARMLACEIATLLDLDTTDELTAPPRPAGQPDAG